MEGAARGFYYGTDGIKGHADLVAVKAQKGTSVAVNTAAAAMDVAAMVVGQYYMTQINAELGKISTGISKISNFQDNEYRSKMFSLVAHVKEIADFQVEILENNELRISKIFQLDRLEENCTQLLGQANLALVKYTNEINLQYADYETETAEAQNWYIYQTTALDILYKISELRYALHLGTVSREHCTALLSTYINRVEETQRLLTAWHHNTAERLSIDTLEARRKRSGIDRVIHSIPGLVNDEWNFKTIEKNTAKMITTQSSGSAHKYDTSDLFAKDVQLISKGCKIYYLPSDNSCEEVAL